VPSTLSLPISETVSRRSSTVVAIETSFNFVQLRWKNASDLRLVPNKALPAAFNDAAAQ
jgi:hypothetical protein